MSGLEMLERLRGAGIHPNLPIFMLTTEGQPSLMQRAKKAGAKGWIVKPFVPALLVATINKVAS
jgi:two-component system chemotaxis response regulator CheY